MVHSLDSYRNIPTARKKGKAGKYGKMRPKTASRQVCVMQILAIRCFAHFLWIRLCASTLTTAESLDSFDYFMSAQKQGMWPESGKTSVFYARARLLAQQCEIGPCFCTPSVDKIVRKGGDFNPSR